MTDTTHASRPTGTLPHPAIVWSAVFLGLVTLFHVLAFTPLTKHVDDIKHVSLLVGGGIGLAIWAFLLFFEHVRIPPKAVLIPYLAYLGVLALSTLIAAPATSKWIGWQTLAMQVSLTGFLLLSSACCCTERVGRWVVRFWIVVVLLTCGFGLLHYAGFMENLQAYFAERYQRDPGRNWLLLYNMAGSFAIRREMLSTVLNTQFFGNFLTLLLPVTFAGIFLAYDRFQSDLHEGVPAKGSLTWLILACAASLMAALCIYLTVSKSAVFLLPLSPILFLAGLQFLTKFRVVRIPAWPVAAAALLIIAATAFLFTSADLKSQFRTVGTSLESRSIIFGGALRMFESSPLLGTGPGSYRLEFPHYRSPDYHLYDISNLTLFSHNIYLDLLAETGILGFATFMFFLGAVAFHAWKAIRITESEPLRVMLIGMCVGILLMYVGNLTTPTMRWPIGSVSVHLMLGIVTGLSLTARHGDQRPRGPRQFSWTSTRVALAVLVAIACLCAIVNTHWAIKFFKGSYHNNSGQQLATEAGEIEQSRERWTQMLAQAREGSQTSQASINELESRIEQARETETRKLREAVDQYDMAIENNPTFVTSYYHQAHALQRLSILLLEEDPGESARYLEASLDAYKTLQEYAPDYSEVHYNLAIVHENAATKAANAAEEPGVPEEERLELLETAQTEYQKAVDSLAKAQRMSNKITVHFVAGQIYELYSQIYAAPLLNDRERWQELQLKAADAFARARDVPFSKVVQDDAQLIEERDQKIEAGRRAAETYWRAQQWDQAAKAYEKLYDLNRGRTQFLQMAIEACKRAGDFERSQSLLDEGLDLNPLNPDMLILRGEVLTEQARATGQWREAWTHLFLLEELDGRIPDLFEGAGQARLYALRSAIEHWSREDRSAARDGEQGDDTERGAGPAAENSSDP